MFSAAAVLNSNLLLSSFNYNIISIFAQYYLFFSDSASDTNSHRISILLNALDLSEERCADW